MFRSPLRMAGNHGHSPLDPAFNRIAEVNQNRYKYFRWTPSTVRISLTYGIIVPLIIGCVAYSTDGLVDFRAKRKGDSLLER